MSNEPRSGRDDESADPYAYGEAAEEQMEPELWVTDEKNHDFLLLEPWETGEVRGWVRRVPFDEAVERGRIQMAVFLQVHGISEDYAQPYALFVLHAAFKEDA